VQPCQIHNADQLGDWCLSHLALNYNSACRRFPKVLRGLMPENQAYLNLNRWPPIWYLKDYDMYQRQLSEQKRSEKQSNLKRSREPSGCLCFTNKSRKGSSWVGRRHSEHGAALANLKALRRNEETTAKKSHDKNWKLFHLNMSKLATQSSQCWWSHFSYNCSHVQYQILFLLRYSY